MRVDTVKSWSFLGYTEIMTRQTNPDGLRETILRISRDLLNEGGPSSLSMREVARRAGCTHQAPYHHFQGREAILVALVEEGYRDLERALANPGVFRIMFRSDMYDAGAHSGLRAASLAARTQLRSLATLAYGTDDPRAEVTLWAYIHGLATLVLDGPPALGAGEEAQRFAHDVIEAPYFIDGV